MKRLFLVPALGVVGLVLASPASAQVAGLSDLNRPSYADEARQPYNESRRVAYDNGYREGVKEGERDARSRNTFDYQDERTWQRADKGYHRSFGDRQRYEQTFRTGFASGYSDAYRRFAPGYDSRGNGGIYPNTRGGYGYPGQGGYQESGSGRLWVSRTRRLRLQPGVREWRERRIRKGTRGRARPRLLRPAATQVVQRRRPQLQELRTARGSSTRTLYRQGFKEGYERGYREWSYRR